LNLALNARDAMPNGGELLIETTRLKLLEPPALTIGRMNAGAYAQVMVADTGIGIAKARLHRLFEPLFTTKARQRGHGLGLFMVQEFISRSEAGLALDSEEGLGTVFRFLLPLAASDPQARPPRKALPTRPADQRPRRVLVVDDDPRVREAVGRLLTLEGMDPTFATQGAEALDILQHDRGFDLILSDIAMPILDGIGLCQTLASERPALPVILMSGQDTSNLPVAHLTRPPIVLRKPIDHRDLRAALAHLDAEITDAPDQSPRVRDPAGRGHGALTRGADELFENEPRNDSI
jgi:CheY-like chemotaxis protein